MEGFWKENSIGLPTGDVVYVQCGDDSVPDKEKITLKVTNGMINKEMKVLYKADITFQDAQKLLAMLTDIVNHGHYMKDIEQMKNLKKQEGEK